MLMDYFDEYEYYSDEETVFLPSYSEGHLVVYVISPLVVLILSVCLIIFMGIFPIGRLSETINRSPEVENVAQPLVVALARLFTAEVQKWEPQILQWAEAWSLDPNLVATVMQIESCGDPKARSVAGATGLFQVMPFHFSEHEEHDDPETNAKRGLAYLVTSLEAQNGDVRLALAGYNAGISRAERSESLWPAETVRFTRWAMGIYQDARKGKGDSATLNEWLATGGHSLCAQASKRLGLKP